MGLSGGGQNSGRDGSLHDRLWTEKGGGRPREGTMKNTSWGTRLSALNTGNV